jgi:hypothetical protein
MDRNVSYPIGAKSGVTNAALALLLMFLVAFPKAGIKVSDVPLTIGYTLIGLITTGAWLSNLGQRRYRTLPRGSSTAYALSLPFQGVMLAMMVNLHSTIIGNSISFVVSFIFLPLAFLLILVPQISTLDPDTFNRYLRRCISFIALYGLILFFYLLATGKFIEVPFLTVNADDVGTLGDKDINRGGGIFKLISTYNNGNIYGVCVLMLLPLYDLIQRSLFWRLVVRISLLLTLSRTVWFGLLVYELIATVYLRQIKRSTLLYVGISVVIVCAAILLILRWMGLDVSFLFDPDLGGRTGVVQATKFYFVPYYAVHFPSEIIYINVVNALGVAGLFFFMVAMASPILLAATSATRRNPYVRACIVGMLMLLICGVSDGPVLLIPTMAFYWGLAALALCGIPWATDRQIDARPQVSMPSQ